MMTARFTPSTESIPHSPTLTVLPPPENPQSAIPSPQSPKPRLTLGIKKKVAKTEAAKPVVPDPTGELGLMVQRIRQRREQVEQLEGAIDIDSAEVTTRVFPHYLHLNRGKLDPEDSLLVATPDGPGLVLFPARYPKIKDADAILPGLRAIIGAETDNLFKTRLSITVDCDAIPQDKQQEVGDALVELFERYGCVDALSQEEITKPVPEFHALRHRILTPEANTALQTAFPISASVKTKGVKG